MCARALACAPQCACGVQRTTCRTGFSRGSRYQTQVISHGGKYLLDHLSGSATDSESEVKDLQGFVYCICDSFKLEIISKQFIHVCAPNYNLFAFFPLDYCCSKNHKKSEITTLVKAAELTLAVCLSPGFIHLLS